MGGRRGELGPQLELLPFVGATPPQIIDGTIADGCDQPGSQRALLGVEAGGVGPDLQESLLHNVLRSTRVPEHSHRDGIGKTRISVVQLQESVLVAGRQDDRELRVGTAFGGYGIT
jgi:hypothetical protein